MKRFFTIIVLMTFVTSVFAQDFDFSAVCESGQTLYYEIKPDGNNEVVLVAPGYPSWTGYVRPAGDVVVPEQVQHQGITYTVVKVNGDVFRECPELISVVIPNTVTYIGNLAFYQDAALESVVLPNGLTSIEDWTFCDCSSLTTVIIPDSLINISDLAFASCSSLVSFSFPNTLETIGLGAFSQCSSLSGDLVLPSSLQSIGGSCFYLCTGLTGVVIPESLNVIPGAAFLGCSSLSGELVIPDQCTLIESEAFSGCSNLSSLTIGAAVATIGYSAFMNCTGLQSIHCNTINLPYTAPIYPNYDQNVVFYNVPTDIPVYVNCLTIDQYRSNLHWNQFTNMEGVFLGTPDLTVSVNNSDLGTAEVVSIPEDCDNGMATVRATPNSGHIFGYWKKNGVVVSYSPEYTFTLNQNCVLTACFDSSVTVYDSIGYPEHVIGRKINSAGQITTEYASDFIYDQYGVMNHYYFSSAYLSCSVSFFDYPSKASRINAVYGWEKVSLGENYNMDPPVTTETYTFNYEDDHQLRSYVRYKGTDYYDIVNLKYNYYYNDHRLFQRDISSKEDGVWELLYRYRYAYENEFKTRIDSGYSNNNNGLSLSNITTNQYDEACRILVAQTDTYNASGVITSQIRKTYSYTPVHKTDSIITRVLNDGIWVNSEMAHYIYDIKNRVVEYQTGSWSAENSTWDISKKTLYDFDDETPKVTISFLKKNNGEWEWDVFSGQSLFNDSQLNEWQRQLNNYSSYQINQFEISMHYDMVETAFPALSEWYYEIQMDNGSITYQQLEYTNDTTINDDKAKVIVRTNQIYDKARQTEVTHEYIMEHNSKVYWWNKELQEFTTLYDYLAESGDEWEIKVGTESIMVHVDSVGVFEYQGDSRKILYISDVGNVFNGGIVVGFGHLTSFFPEKLMAKEGYEVGGLRCYWVGDALMYHHGDEDCDAIHNILDAKENVETDGFGIYPNPTDGLLHVETLGAPTQTEYRIMNPIGQILMAGLMSDATIDVSTLLPGMYFLVLGEKTFKFVKQ